LSQPLQGESEYLQSHVPGAVYADLERDLSATRYGTNGRHPLPAPPALAVVFSRLGIDDSCMVVAYDRSGGPYASRLWWTLRYLGHSKVGVLDGGFPAWLKAGYPVRSGGEKRNPSRFVPSVQTRMLVNADEIERAGEKTLRLLDARAPERYRGDEEPLDPAAGHIPGAVNVFWKDNLDEEGGFISSELLEVRYRRVLGRYPPSAAVAYCGSGVTACHLLLAMEQAGVSGARLYAGSWSEWSSDSSRPVALGDEPLPTGS
jgi:thiosulfate/3-mercaptopyruvate sulfurtransferase